MNFDCRTPLVIVGYPKSGNTWLTRLLAEIIDAKVSGYMTNDSVYDDVVVEGVNRSGNQIAFKTHIPIEEAIASFSHCRFVYISRDPRDVCVSLSHYYDMYNKELSWAEVDSKGKWVERLLLKTTSIGLRRSYLVMVYGGGAYAYSLSKSLINFRHGWEASGVPQISFEGLLNDGVSEITRVLSELGVFVESDVVNSAMQNQSFDEKKRQFLKQGEIERLDFMRSGKSGVWKNEMPLGLRILCFWRWRSLL